MAGPWWYVKVANCLNRQLSALRIHLPCPPLLPQTHTFYVFIFWKPKSSSQTGLCILPGRYILHSCSYFFFFFFLVLVPDVSSQLIAHCPKHSAWIQVPSCVTWGILWDLSVPSRGKVEWIWSWHESDQSPPRLVSSARWDNIHEVCQRACDTGEHTPNVCCSWSVRSAAGPPRAFDCLVDTYSSGVTAAGLERPRWACKEASLCCSSVSQTVS